MPLLSISFWTVVLVLGAVHGLGLFAFLLRKPYTHRLSRLCLAALTLIISLLLIDFSINLSGLHTRWPFLIHLFSPLWYLVGPLFYGYIRFQFPGREQWEPEDLIHLIPALIRLYAHGIFFLLPTDAKLAALREPIVPGSAYTLLILMYVLQSAAYAYITLRLVSDYERAYRREASGPTAVHLQTLRHLLSVFALYASMVALNVGLMLVWKTYTMALLYLVPLVLAGLVYTLAYLALRGHAYLFPPLSLTVVPSPITDRPATPRPELGRYRQRLDELMQRDRPYLNPELRLADLASALDVSERTLSQVFSEAIGESFYDVVNGYRVEAFKARVADPAYEHLTLLGIGLDCGFSNKASLHRVFKQHTGMTPSAYRSSLQPRPSAKPLNVSTHASGASD